jgi:hypothetical protein
VKRRGLASSSYANRAFVLALLTPLALAFSDTVPFVAWSSHQFGALDFLTSRLPKAAHVTHIVGSILHHKDVCSYDAVIVIEQSGLHASDLRTLPLNSRLNDFISKASSSFQLPYVHHPAPISLKELASSTSSKCGSKLISFNSNQGTPALETAFKHVIYVNAPHLKEHGRMRKSSMVENDSLLSSHLSGLASVFPKHLVILAGASSSFSKRQSPSTTGNAFDSPQTNSTITTGGILKHYQLLTPGLITTLLVVFFIIVPVVMLGISALSSIQSPLRVDVPKSFSAQERKTQ